MWTVEEKSYIWLDSFSLFTDCIAFLLGTLVLSLNLRLKTNVGHYDWFPVILTELWASVLAYHIVMLCMHMSVQ